MAYEKIKRMLDILFSMGLIIFLSPIFLITAIIVKLESDGPIFFKQERLGKYGKLFYLYKFRSMTKENNVMDFTVKDKVTKFGKFIRKYGIDELPQLFNILKGEMSIIGPRPQLVKYMDYYTDYEKQRLSVLPGLLGPNTCTYTKKDIIDKNKLDVSYALNLSFKEDINILFNMIKNFMKILNFREEGSLGNKMNVQEELKLFEERDSLNKESENNLILKEDNKELMFEVVSDKEMKLSRNLKK